MVGASRHAIWIAPRISLCRKGERQAGLLDGFCCFRATAKPILRELIDVATTLLLSTILLLITGAIAYAILWPKRRTRLEECKKLLLCSTPFLISVVFLLVARSFSNSGTVELLSRPLLSFGAMCSFGFVVTHPLLVWLSKQRRKG